MFVHARKTAAAVGVVALAAGVATATPAAAQTARAGVPVIGVSPLTQNVAAGNSAIWGVSASGGTAPARVTINYGNGTGTHATGTFSVSRVFRPCAARSTTYTQRFTITDAKGENNSTTTTVKVSYTGPICN